MRFRIMSSPACSDRCRWGISRGSSARQRSRSGSISAASMDDRRRRGSSGTSFRMRATSWPRRRLRPAGRRPSGDVDAGQHHLGDSPGRPGARTWSTTSPAGDRARVAAAVGDDAEGAAVVAAVLDLDIGAGAVLQPVDQVAGGLAHAHDVVDPHARPAARRRRRPAAVFSALPSTRSTSGMAAKAAGSIWAAQPVTMSRASGPLAARLADRLARLAHRLAGDGAGVEDRRRRSARRPRRAPWPARSHRRSAGSRR